MRYSMCMEDSLSEAARKMAQSRWKRASRKKRKAHGKLLLDSRTRAKAKRDAKAKLDAAYASLDTPIELG